MNRLSMLAFVCLAFAVGCADGPTHTPGQTDPGMDQPDAGAPSPAQNDPDGVYLGTLTLQSMDGPDTSTCSRTAIGTQITHHVTFGGGIVTERNKPSCTITNPDPTDFGFTCVNHDIDQTCTDPATCANYTETRVFSLHFDLAAKHVVGTVVDTRNWGGCSVRRWSAVYDWTRGG